MDYEFANTSYLCVWTLEIDKVGIKNRIGVCYKLLSEIFNEHTTATVSAAIRNRHSRTFSKETQELPIYLENSMLSR